MGGADASRGEHKAAGADALFQPQDCAADVPLIVWHILNARQVHSPAATVSMLPENRIAAVIRREQARGPEPCLSCHAQAWQAAWKHQVLASSALCRCSKG